mmetsp:Transcript_17090/g.20119  ORF Transcript_17090/g.20119 Transcript_17090/m.20119 type:complete len:245 (+) Transcript_17090:11-745(+)
MALFMTRFSPTTLPLAISRTFSTCPRVLLTDLVNNPGNNKDRKRKGRGVGSGMGKTATRGHKGQKSRSGRNPHRGFEGGQMPIQRLAPKRGFKNSKFTKNFVSINLRDVQLYIDMGRLTPQEGKPITMRDLVLCGIVTRVGDGVKLLGEGRESLTSPIEIEVSRASASAIEAIERVGGTVTTVHYNQLALRALIRPESFLVLPKIAKPPPKLMPYYLDYQNRGFLSPEMQLAKQLKKLGISSLD